MTDDAPRLRWFLPALGVALLLGACKGGPNKAEWVTAEVQAASDRLLWEVTVLALDKEGFPVGSGVDPTTMIALSGWRNSLHPFRGEGYREQAEIRYERLDPKGYKIDVRIQRQINNDMVRPLDLSYAEWKDAPDNQSGAQVLLQVIQSFLGTELEISDPTPVPGER